MADADSILQGCFIGGLGFAGLVTLIYCLKKKAKTYHMKKSASMDELSSVDTTDPTQTQDEERYALPPVLVTIASPRMGSSSAGR
jgi:hypothetical protein